jgi:HJR/Mrr/RecB family endonuclease
MEWAKLQSLPELELLQSIFMEDEIDGEEFIEMKPKMLRRMLKKAGAVDPDGSAQVILAQRVDTRMQQQGRPETVAASLRAMGEMQVHKTESATAAKLIECPFCFEEYSESGDSDKGLLVPRIITKCGHTAW